MCLTWKEPLLTTPQQGSNPVSPLEHGPVSKELSGGEGGWQEDSFSFPHIPLKMGKKKKKKKENRKKGEEKKRRRRRRRRRYC